MRKERVYNYFFIREFMVGENKQRKIIEDGSGVETLSRVKGKVHELS